MVHLSHHRKALNPNGRSPSSSNLPIGIFDSGVGGLTVLQTIQQLLPDESIIYLGDTAHLPYGTKKPDEIIHFARMTLNWMLAHPVKMVIMACNTSSALALETIQPEFDIPILGVILPAAHAAITHGDRIGIIATPATASSHAYCNAIHGLKATTHVWEIGCPELVPLIEGDRVHEPETHKIVQHYLNPLIERRIDTLIYGCTHYPHLSPIVRRILPSTIQVIDPAVHVATTAKQVLHEHALQNTILTMEQSTPTTRFFVSDRPNRFSQVAARLLGYTPTVKEVDIGEPLPTLVLPSIRKANRIA